MKNPTDFFPSLQPKVNPFTNETVPVLTKAKPVKVFLGVGGIKIWDNIGEVIGNAKVVSEE